MEQRYSAFRHIFKMSHTSCFMLFFISVVFHYFYYETLEKIGTNYQKQMQNINIRVGIARLVWKKMKISLLFLLTTLGPWICTLALFTISGRSHPLSTVNFNVLWHDTLLLKRQRAQSGRPTINIEQWKYKKSWEKLKLRECIWTQHVLLNLLSYIYKKHMYADPLWLHRRRFLNLATRSESSVHLVKKNKE